jgi:hypothetical protein
MRWLYYHPANDFEAGERAAVLSRVDAWWREFARRASDIDTLFTRRRGTEWDLPGWMNEYLQAIHPDLMWEYGRAMNCEGHRLAITPESELGLRPLTQVILSRAPSIPGWEFYGYRVPEPLDEALASVHGRTGIDLAGTRVRASIGEGNVVDLAFFSDACPGGEDQQSLHAGLVVTESLLGEQVLNEWIGAIGMFPNSRAGRGSLIPLDKLKPTVQALVGSIVDQFPAAPARPVPDGEWTGSVLQLSPERAEDYPRRQDLWIAVTDRLPVWREAHSGRSFYSHRFSRIGETFCFLKIDRDETFDDPVQDRARVEEGLDAALGAAGLGAVFGGGTGLRYSYVDLALTDVRAAIPLLRETLRAGGIPQRTWLLFFDATLADEWVGMVDDRTPPPSTVSGDGR